MSVNVIIPIALCGFHNTISMLALYHAYVALRRAGHEGHADARTLWRLSWMRLTLVFVALCGGIVGVVLPLAVLAESWIVLPFYDQIIAIFFFASWLIWAVSTIALENLSLRWFGSGDHRS